jgi:hypothetical protein
MRQHRSKNAITLQFGERDYLPTIIEGQPINIGIPPSLKISLLASCPSRNDEGDMKENTSDTCGFVSREVEVRKGNNSSEEPRASTLASDIIHGKKYYAIDCSNLNSSYIHCSLADAAHETQTWKLRRWRLI